MAMHGYAGVFVKLKDKTLTVEERLKLLRFAWKSDEVFIPNKEQALIDLLGSCLLDKKKDELSAEDVWRVWQCLHDVLQTQRVQGPARQGKELTVKQSMAQLLTDSLATVDGGRQSSLRPIVVGCCQAVITSPVLAHLFTARLDVMLSLICNLLKTDSAAATEGIELRLLSTIVDKYVKGLRTAPNHNQILQTMCDKLLPVLIPLWSESPSSCAETASKVFLAAFTHKDHLYGLNLFLQTSQSDAKQNKRAKMASHVFATFEKFLQTQDAEKMVYFLCEIFNSYASRNCHEGNLQNSFNMVVQLCHLIGLKKDSAAPCGIVAPPALLRGVNRLLTVLHSQEQYSVTGDQQSGQLAFYRHLAKLLVSVNCISADWFSNFTLLLRLNHHIVEPILQDILTTGWIGNTAKLADESVAALDVFLEELIVTYNKLRQVPKVVTKLLDTLSGCHGDDPILMTPRFFKSFGEMTQSLPQGTMVDIWKTFVSKMKETFVGESTQQSGNGHFQGVVCLLHYFMTNARVSDYTVTEIASQGVQELMVAMETDILSPLLKLQLDSKKIRVDLPSLLHLCYSWGEVLAMLAQYKQYRASHFQTCELVSHPHDLSYVHSYLNKDQWSSLHKKLGKGDSPALYVWDMLLVQKARTVLLFKDTSAWSVAKDVMATLLTFPDDLTKTVSMATWSKSLVDITEESLSVARWHLMTTSLSALYCGLTPDQLQSIAGWVLKTLASPTATHKAAGVTVGDISREFLGSPWVRECAGLQSHLVTAAMATCSDCFNSPTPKGKKRKSGACLASFLKLLDTLASQDVDWTQNTDSKVMERLQSAGECLGAVLGDTEGPQNVPALSTLDTCLQVLEILPLEEMESCDQIRCLTGLLSLLAIVSRGSQQSGNAGVGSVRDKCVSMCTVLLDTCSPAKVFSVVDLDSYLTWLSHLSVMEENKVGFHRLLLLMKVSCDAVMKQKDADMLEKLVPWIDKSFSNMAAGVAEQEVIGMLGLSSLLLQSITKILTRAYIKDYIQQVCTRVYQSLTKRLLELPPQLADPGQDKTGGHRAAFLVNCYSSLVSVYFLQNEVKEAFLPRFTSVLSWCREVLQQSRSTASLYEKMAALNFLYSISKFHTGLDAVYTQDVKLDTWLLLVGVLKSMLGSQSQINLGSQLQTNLGNQSQTSSVPGQTRQKQSSQSRLSTDPTISSSELDSSEACDRKEKLQRISNLLQGKTLIENERQHIIPHKQKSPTSRTQEASSIKQPTGLDGGIMQYSAITQWYGCLVFEGGLEGRKGELLLALVQSVMAALLTSLEIEDFDRIVCRLVQDVHSNKLLDDPTTLQSSLFIWRNLLQLDFSEEQTKILKKSAKNMMLNFQCILQQLHHCRDDVVVMETVVPILNAQLQILTMPKKLLRSQMILLCLHSCAYAPLGGSTYFAVFHAVCNVLDALLVQHEKPVLQCIPAYISCAKKLLLSVVDQSDQDSVSHDLEVVNGLKSCAYQMERLFTLISTHKVEFGKVATYVVADYVTAVQKVTLVPAIKRALVPAVNKMLDLCDSHAVAQLHTVLSHGVIDVFKLLYHEYTKFHKYTGKI